METSIVICSLNREESLKRCLDSIHKQDYMDYEISICQEEGNLVELKDRGWRNSKSKYILWLDDDVVLREGCLKHLIKTLERNDDIVGVTGPTYVSKEYRINRDVFKEGWFKKLYNWYFLEGKAYLPGRITSCGANTLGANYETEETKKFQVVDFLEPPMFAMKREAVDAVAGFDLRYRGVAEWCDVDLCYRIKKYGLLVFNPCAICEHYPEKGDEVYNKRLETASRYRNYCLFSSKFIKPTFKHQIYKAFLRTYFFLKERRMI